MTSSLARDCCDHDGCAAFSADAVSRLICNPCGVVHDYDFRDCENQTIIAMPLGHPRSNHILHAFHQIQSCVEHVDYDISLEDEMMDHPHHGGGSLRMTCLASRPVFIKVKRKRCEVSGRRVGKKSYTTSPTRLLTND